MKTSAAILYEMGLAQPYAESSPLVVDEITLEEPGPGEVLVEIVSAGLCHSDLSVVDGSRPRVMPMVLGHEASGIVRAVGPTVPGGAELAAGDHVVFSWVPVCGRCHYCVTGRSALCEPGGAANLAELCSAVLAVLLTHVRSRRKLAIITWASRLSHSSPSPRRSRW